MKKIIIFFSLALLIFQLQAQDILEVGSHETECNGIFALGYDDGTDVNLLYRAEDLVVNDQKLAEGYITQISLYVTYIQDYDLDGFTIQLCNTSQDEFNGNYTSNASGGYLDGLSGSNWSSNTYSSSPSSTGWYILTLAQPFYYDGVSNIGIMISTNKYHTYDDSNEDNGFLDEGFIIGGYNTTYTSLEVYYYNIVEFEYYYYNYPQYGLTEDEFEYNESSQKLPMIRFHGTTCSALLTSLEIPETITLDLDHSSEIIIPTFTPGDVCNTNFSLHTTNSNVAGVEDGTYPDVGESIVYINAPGTAEIYAVSEDGSIESNRCTVTVSNGLDPDDYAALVAVINTIGCSAYNTGGFYDEMGVNAVDENGKILDLDLSSCGSFSEIPPELFSLDQLRSLNLSGTGISSIPAEISTLTNLEYLDVSGCLLSDLPTLPASLLGELDVSDNLLEIDDLTPLIPAMGNGLIVTYIPQEFTFDLLPIITRKNAFLNYDHDFTTTDIGPGVVYDLQIPGEDIIVLGNPTNTITLPNITSESAATYQIKARHPSFPGLECMSEQATIEVINKEDYDAAVAIYKNMNGPNWDNSPDMTDVFSQWGFCDPNIYVLGLYLDNNNVAGEFPPELSYLTHIDGIYASNNNISGTFPVEFLDNLDQFTNLGDISLGDNNLSGQIPAQLFSGIPNGHLGLYENNFSGELDQSINTTIAHIDLYSNSLEGKVPQGLITADVLDVHNNNFTELPDISVFSGTELDLSMNHFDFEDFLPYKDMLPAPNITYYPQKPFDVANNVFEKFEGETITMSVDVAGDSYQWYHDDVLITGAEAQELTIGPISPSDAGKYHCEVGHNDFSFTLQSKDFVVYINDGTGLVNGVDIQDYRALVALYIATNGSGWDDNDGWLTNAPVDTWYNIYVTSDRVTAIDLYGNNLVGELPVEIGQLSAIQYLFLSNNSLTGVLPTEFANLTNLAEIYLNNNDFSGQFPDIFPNMASLDYLYLQNNNFSGEFPALDSPIGELDISNNSFEGAFDFAGSQFSSIDLSNNNITRIDNYPAGLEFSIIDVTLNKLSFTSLQDIATKTPDGYFFYPQKPYPVNENVISLLAGQEKTLGFPTVGGQQVLYQWTRDNENIGPESIDDFYTISSFTTSDQGMYQCIARLDENLLSPQLAALFAGKTLQSEIISVSEFPWQYGDVNLSKVVNAFDAAIVLVKSLPDDVSKFDLPNDWSPGRTRIADVNGDEQVGPMDASQILQYAVGMRFNFSVEAGAKSIAGKTGIHVELDGDALLFVADNPLYGLNLSYDNSPCSGLGEPVCLADQALFATNITNEQYKVALASAEPIAAGSAFMKIPYDDTYTKYMFSATANYTDLNIEADIKNLSQVASSVGHVAGAGSKITVAPNPFKDKMQFIVEKAAPGNLKIDIFDSSGKLVSTVANNTVPQGAHHFQWGTGAGPGMYIYRCSMGNTIETGYIIKINK